MACAYLDVPNARIAWLDLDYSSFVLAHLLGADYGDVGPALCPLVLLDQEGGLEWICGWFERAFARWNFVMDERQAEEFTSALREARRPWLAHSERACAPSPPASRGASKARRLQARKGSEDHMRILYIRVLTALAFAFLLTSSKAYGGKDAKSVEWPYYGNDPGAQRYSQLDQINRGNVSQLMVVWTYHTGEISNGQTSPDVAHGKWRFNKTGFENTPIVVDGTMYISTPFCRVVALNPETGTEKWSYDPQIGRDQPYSEGLINRAVSSWLDPQRKRGEACQRRIFIGTIDARLIALDAASGKRCVDFGDGGTINLKTGIKNIEKIGYYGEYEETSPPAIIDYMVIVGSGIGDNRAVDEPLGTVRAFDARTGALRWSWDLIPQGPSDPAWKDWKLEDAQRTGAGNTWAPISVDPENELVFLPVGSASPDYFGGARRGSDIYSDSLVALRAKTGKIAWYFQTTHHDLWDYDNPAQPLLCTIHRNGVDISAVVQGTKRGQLFVLNRVTGQPLFPIEEKPVPQSDVPGEETSPTQPFPTLPPPLCHNR
jgi:quinoprotein glucose dehydrogenase